MVGSDELFDAGERFEVRNWLGAGGMGVVYEAYDRELQELVALKTLRHADGRWLARFKREFRSLHDLAHPNLVALGELFDGESEPFFTMELIRGVDFLAHIRETTDGTRAAKQAGGANDAQLVSPSAPTGVQALAPTMPVNDTSPAGSEVQRGNTPAPRATVPISYDERRLRAALKQLALGMAAVHEAGKVHRDIKPSNILITPDGRVVLLDFGLVAEMGKPLQSAESAVVGTVAYMAPEQARSGQVTPAADWYSLGVLLFEALTGALPHTGASPYEVIMKKHDYMAAPPRQFVATAPPDLDALCTRLLQIEASDRPLARDIFDRLGIDSHHELATDSIASHASLTMNAPFVGRSEQLEVLRAAHLSVRDAPLVCLVEGVSGVGKSQLVAQFIDRLRQDEPDTVVLQGRCYEREVVSYKAFDGIADALAQYLARLPSVQVAELMPRRPALLARLFPVLKRVEAIAAAGTIPDVPDPHDQRLRMFAALRELFLRLAERRRLVWYIDDLQWTDADSLVLLQDLIAHQDKLPVLIIATMRPVNSAPRRTIVAQVRELAATKHLQLEELARAEARELAEILLPGQDPGTLDTIASDAGGHPLFLHELARHAGSSQRPGAGASTFDGMLTSRVGRLASDVQTLLQVVSIYGGPMTQEVAALAAELSNAEQIKASRILRAAHLARTDGVQRSDRIFAYHDRVREHVSASLDASRRKQLHERLALALEQTGAAEHNPRALVRHARAAGRHVLAASYAQTAARHAVASLAFDQAAEFFAAAIELGTHEQAPLRELRIELATALMHAGRGPEAASTFVAAAEGAEPAVRLYCQGQAADQWIITGHLEEGLTALKLSLDDIGEPLATSPRRALARVVWNRARLRLRGMGYKQRLESQIPVETLRRLDVLKAVAHGYALVDYIRGADFNGRFLLLALRIGEARRLLGAMASEIIFLASQGGSAGRRGRKLYDELVRLAEDCPDQAYRSTWLLLADGAASFLEGRFLRAQDALEKAEEVFAGGPGGLTYERNNTRVFRVHSLRLLGRLRQQDSLINEWVRTGRQRGDRYLETTLKLLQGQSFLARDDLSGAREGIEGATWSPLEDGFHLQHWNELRARAELALYEQTAHLALESLDQTFKDLHGSMLLRAKIVRADAVALRGRLLVAAASEGHATDGAHAEVMAIVRRLERERIGYASVYALLLRAGLRCLDTKQTEEQTISHLRQAAEHAQENDMALHLAAARDRLGARLGGDEGAELRAAATGYAAGEELVRPDRMFGVIAPGLDSL